MITWADLHPEVAEIFSRPFTEWPCERIDTGLGPVVQPCVAKGQNEEVFVLGNKGHIIHSTDRGKSWALLCQAPPCNPKIPRGYQLAHHVVDGTVDVGGCDCGGIGVSQSGTLLLVWSMSYNDGRGDRTEQDESFHKTTWITRSEDGGRTWERTDPFDAESREVTSANQGNVARVTGGGLLVPLLAKPWSRPGRTLSTEQARLMATRLYRSDDDGMTWNRSSDFVQRAAEPHILELASDQLIAAIRYQRNKSPQDPDDFGTAYTRELWGDFAHGKGHWIEPTDVGVRAFQNTAITMSSDTGRTWSVPKLVTGLLQQSASLVRLSDGTLVMTFGRPGQRFLLSYDGGASWSHVVYQLHHTGEYARSVVLEDDTILVIHDFGRYMHYRKGDPRLGVIRFKAPAREEVERHGFFSPREVEKGLRA